MSGAGAGVLAAKGAGRSGRDRLKAYRLPIIGGFAAVLLTITAVTAAAAWSGRDDGKPNTPGAGGAAPDGAASVAAAAASASLLWQATGVPATEPPAVTADRVLVSGQDGVLRAFRRADGQLDWELPVGDGVRVADEVPGGVAYAITAAGRLVAVDAERGTELWRRETGSPVDGRPAVGANRIFAGGDGTVDAYQPGGNHRRWRARPGTEIAGAPAVSGEIAVVAGGDGRLYGVDGTGGLPWKRSVGGRITAGPVIAGDAACVAVDDGSVRCLGATDGEPLSKIDFPDDTPPVAVAGKDGAVFVTTADRAVSAWDTHGGGLRWRFKPAGGPAEAGFPAVRTADEVAVAYPDGRVTGIDAGLGTELWGYTAAADHFSAAPRGDEAGLFAVGDSGTLYALRPPGSSAVLPSPTPEATYSVPEPTTDPTRTRTQRTRTTRPTYSTSKASPTPTATTTEPPPSTRPTPDPTATDPVVID